MVSDLGSISISPGGTPPGACACVLSPFSCVRLSATLWAAALLAPLSMGFSRRDYWSGFPGSSPGDLPHPGIKRKSLTSPASAGGFFNTWEASPTPTGLGVLSNPPDNY